jgi:hypothetical protein
MNTIDCSHCAAHIRDRGARFLVALALVLLVGVAIGVALVWRA